MSIITYILLVYIGLTIGKIWGLCVNFNERKLERKYWFSGAITVSILTTILLFIFPVYTILRKKDSEETKFQTLRKWFKLILFRNNEYIELCIELFEDTLKEDALVSAENKLSAGRWHKFAVVVVAITLIHSSLLTTCTNLCKGSKVNKITVHRYDI